VAYRHALEGEGDRPAKRADPRFLGTEPGTVIRPISPPNLKEHPPDDHKRYLIRSTTVARSGEAGGTYGRVAAARAARERLWGRALGALVRPHQAGHPQLGEDAGQAHACSGTLEEPALGCAVQAHGCPGTPEEPALGCAVGCERTRAGATQAHRWT
jgi:hypothetical protein